MAHERGAGNAATTPLGPSCIGIPGSKPAALVSLHHLQVPDVDFLLHLGDGSAALPLVQANINRGQEQAGFTLPKFMWRDALGPEQFAVLAECLQVSSCTTPAFCQENLAGLALGAGQWEAHMLDCCE